MPEKLTNRERAAFRLLDYAWNLIDATSEGDWGRQRDEWQHDARAFREMYFNLLERG